MARTPYGAKKNLITNFSGCPQSSDSVNTRRTHAARATQQVLRVWLVVQGVYSSVTRLNASSDTWVSWIVA